MKKLSLYAVVALFAVSCAKDAKSLDSMVEKKDTAAIAARKTELEAELAKVDSALAKLQGTKVEQALVSFYTVKDTLFNHFVEVQGSVDTKQNIIVYPEFSGTLEAVNVKAGQHVTKGQVLARIDDGGLGQQVAQLETQAALAKTTYERQKRLWDQKIGSEIQFLQAKTTMEAQQKAVSQAKAQLAKTVVRAPFTGTIDEVMGERGQVVAPGQGLMRIVNLSDMYVSTTVPETYVGKLKVGTPVEVSLAALNKTYQGKVRQVANNINPANRSFGIEVAVPNNDNLLRPNQSAKLKIVDYTSKSATVVPTSVIQEDGKGTKFVFVVEGGDAKSGIAKKTPVKVGSSSGNSTEILSGLKEGDRVVTEGANSISEGMKLNF